MFSTKTAYALWMITSMAMVSSRDRPRERARGAQSTYRGVQGAPGREKMVARRYQTDEPDYMTNGPLSPLLCLFKV